MKQKRKILIVTDYYLPHWTGLSKSLLYLTSATSKEIEWTILTVQYEKSLPRIEKRPEATVLRTPALFRLSRTFVSAALITRAFQEIPKHDLIYINSPCTYMLPVAILAKIRRKPLMVFHQGDLILPPGIANRIIQSVFDVSSYISCMIASKVCTYVKDYAGHSRLLKHFLPKCSFMIPPLPRAVKPSEKVLRSIQNKMPLKKIYIGFAGRFVSEKGFDYLLQAIPEVCRKNPNIHFVYAGQLNISYERFFQDNAAQFEAAREHITDLGLLDEEALNAFYEIIDFIAIPSRSDCFNLVQAEAMLHGAPSVVADIPGARHLVTESGFGMVFKAQDAAALSAAILAAASHKQTLLAHRPALDRLLDTNRLKKNALSILT